jgi:hypothetical protein
MRQLTVGLAIGFLFGTTLAASAGYIDQVRWTQMDPSEQIAYVAGVADAIESINAANQTLGAGTAARFIAEADQCTDPLKLGEVRDIAVRASIRRSDVTPATNLILALADCSPSPAPQPK